MCIPRWVVAGRVAAGIVLLTMLLTTALPASAQLAASCGGAVEIVYVKVEEGGILLEGPAGGSFTDTYEVSVVCREPGPNYGKLVPNSSMEVCIRFTTPGVIFTVGGDVGDPAASTAGCDIDLATGAITGTTVTVLTGGDGVAILTLTTTNDPRAPGSPDLVLSVVGSQEILLTSAFDRFLSADSADQSDAHIFALTQPVPEADSIVLFGVGALLLGGYVWKQRKPALRGAQD
jgi:hypothetical protein